MRFERIIPLRTKNLYYTDPEKCRLDPGIIFVYGSNTAGIHGAGTALTAREKYGAEPGKGQGLVGRSYGIPTKDATKLPNGKYDLSQRKIEEVFEDIQKFIQFTHANPEFTFYVANVGTGLAGFTIEQIAPMFNGAIRCWFHLSWKPFHAHPTTI